MKISLGSWAFSFGPFAADPIPFEKTVKRLSAAGYDGIEICGFPPHVTLDKYPTKESRKELVRFLKDHRLGVSGLCGRFQQRQSGGRGQQTEVPRSVPAQCADVRGYRQPGDPRGFGGRAGLDRRPAITQASFDRLAGVWREAAGIAQDAGIRLVWEFEPGFAFNKPSEVVSMHQSVGHPNFFVMFDTSHAYMCGVVGARQHGRRKCCSAAWRSSCDKLEGRIGAIHLIDSDGTLHGDETSTHRPFGEGSSISRRWRRNCSPCRISSGGASTCASGRAPGSWWNRAGSSWPICCARRQPWDDAARLPAASWRGRRYHAARVRAQKYDAGGRAPDPQAKFPVVDVHTHVFGLSRKQDPEDLKQIAAWMDECNLQTLVNLTGGNSETLPGIMQADCAVRASLRHRCEPTWKRAYEPGFAKWQADELEKCKQHGARCAEDSEDARTVSARKRQAGQDRRPALRSDVGGGGRARHAGGDPYFRSRRRSLPLSTGSTSATRSCRTIRTGRFTARIFRPSANCWRRATG